MLIASCAGHSAKSPGASGNGYREHEVARLINAAFVAIDPAHITDCTSDASTSRAVLTEQASGANASGAEVAVSFHLNATVSIPPATGVEVLYSTRDSNGRAIAERAADDLSRLLGIRNRGAKGRSDLFWLNETRMTSILVEVGFIDNPTDIKAIIENVDAIAASVYEAITGVEVNKQQYALFLAHMKTGDAIVAAYKAIERGHAASVAPVGQDFTGSISHTDALAYVLDYGAPAVSKFRPVNGDGFSVFASHMKYEDAMVTFTDFCNEVGSACLLRKVGRDVDTMLFENHTEALNAVLINGFETIPFQ